MFRNYLKVAVRAFLNRKLYSFINVTGLAVSLACAIFIALYIQDQLSVDAWEENSANVWQVSTQWTVPGLAGEHLADLASAEPAGPAITADIPEVEAYARTASMDYTTKADNRQFTTSIADADPNFFDVIRLPFFCGNAQTALRTPNSAVLSYDTAMKFFGSPNVIGRTITIEGKYSFQVSAVLNKLSKNTQFKSDIYISAAGGVGKSALSGKIGNWGDESNTQTYVRLMAQANPAEVMAKLPGVIRRHCDFRAFLKNAQSADHYLHLGLVRLKDVSLDAPDTIVDGSGRTMMYGFAIIALLILIIASVNFTNLSTALASLRAREVALRKTVGANRGQLITQFLGESVLTAFLGLVLALALTEILLPAFNGMLGSNITFSYFHNFPLLITAIGMALACGLIGGLYPALVMSGFRPGLILKSGRGSAQGSGRLRNTLVVGQFAISIGLGIIALTIFAQIHYARNIDLGFNKDNIVYIANGESLSEAERQTLIQRLLATPAIDSAATSDYRPFGGMRRGISVIAPRTGSEINGRVLSIDPSYARVYGLRLLAGRNFDNSHGADKMSGIETSANLMDGHNVMIDAAMADALGLTTAEAIGKTITAGSNNARVRIVGVFSTIRMFGADATPEPAIYRYLPSWQDIISVHIRGGQIPEGLNAIDHVWHSIAPNTEIQRHFIDNDFDRTFESANQQARLFTIFVAIAIFTAALGLFGLAAFTAERKKKEISIRKVFGATKGHIIRLLIWRFSIPVLIANIIAWPVAYLWLHHWLEGYAYHINLSPLYFIASGLAALLIAWLTISANAWQTASVPPARALRSE